LTLILICVLLFPRFQPSLDDGLERCCVQIVQLVLALPDGCYEARRLQYFQVLRDRLPRESKLMFHRQTTAQLKESLAISLDQFVKNRAARWSRACLENIAHRGDNRQVMTCLSRARRKTELRIFSALRSNTMVGEPTPAQQAKNGVAAQKSE